MVAQPACQQVFNWYYKISKWTCVVSLVFIGNYLFLIRIDEPVRVRTGVVDACHFGLVLVGSAAEGVQFRSVKIFKGKTMTDYWDDWQREALAAGVKAPLAKLGMEVLKTHRKNRWPSHFLGRMEDGPMMIEMCLEEPDETELLFVENLHPYDDKLIAATKKRLCFD
jgi:hypothetical protein